MIDKELLELAAKAAGIKLGEPLKAGACFPHLIGGFNLAEAFQLTRLQAGVKSRLAPACVATLCTEHALIAIWGD